jgi:hypothetical protein
MFSPGFYRRCNSLQHAALALPFCAKKSFIFMGLFGNNRK